MQLLNSPDFLEMLENRTGISINEKEIFPFILVNHHFFNGYKELQKYEHKDGFYPIIDFMTLKTIIKSKKIPVWEYRKRKNSYKRRMVDWSDGKELAMFLNNQFHGFISIEEPTYQILEDQIMFRIIKPFSFI